MNAAFDVGADDGLHGLLFAFFNPKISVFGFEPIKNAKRKILKNLRKVEKFFGIKIKNYKIINSAVSNFNGYAIFYENHYRVSSSLLKPKNRLSKCWTQSEDLLIKTVSKKMKIKKKYKVKVLTLEKFCKKNSIKIINYLHIDAQGHDLKVIEGLKGFRNYLIKGVSEISKNYHSNLYYREKSFINLKKKFKLWKFKITNIETVQKNMPYLNVEFMTSNEISNEENKINFYYPSKRFGRMFKRIFLDKANFKDIVLLYFWKLKTRIL